jgi:hypothetical protein
LGFGATKTVLAIIIGIAVLCAVGFLAMLKKQKKAQGKQNSVVVSQDGTFSIFVFFKAKSMVARCSRRST